MSLRFNWGGGKPTPTPTPSNKILRNAGKEKYKPQGAGSQRQASIDLRKNRKNNSGNAGAKVVGNAVNVAQQRAFKSIQDYIANQYKNPNYNELQTGENNKQFTMRNPYAAYTVQYTGNQYAPYTITPNNISLNKGASTPISYSGMGGLQRLNYAQKNNALTYNGMGDLQRRPNYNALTYNGMGDLQLLNYYQSLLNENAMSYKKQEDSYSPTYYGGWGGYGGGGYGGDSYSPFDFFFNLLNWRI